MTLNLNNSNDIICNSFSIIENGQLLTLDQKIASGSTDDINAIINNTTNEKCNMPFLEKFIYKIYFFFFF